MTDIDIVYALLTNLIASYFNDQLPSLPHTNKDFCPVLIALLIFSALNCLSCNFTSWIKQNDLIQTKVQLKYYGCLYHTYYYKTIHYVYTSQFSSFILEGSICCTYNKGKWTFIYWYHLNWNDYSRQKS